MRIRIVLIIILALIVFSAWLIVGFGVAWLLDQGLSVEVNKHVFINTGCIIGLLHGGFVLLIGIVQNLMLGSMLKKTKETEKRR